MNDKLLSTLLFLHAFLAQECNALDDQSLDAISRVASELCERLIIYKDECTDGDKVLSVLAEQVKELAAAIKEFN